MKSTGTACAVMLHHFHDGRRHLPSQGSIDAGQFAALLDYLRVHRRLLSAPEYLERALSGALTPEDTCLTVDDALLSQYEIAISSPCSNVASRRTMPMTQRAIRGTTLPPMPSTPRGAGVSASYVIRC